MLLLMWGGSAEAIRTSYAYKNASLAQAEDESKIRHSARFASYRASDIASAFCFASRRVCAEKGSAGLKGCMPLPGE